MVEKIIFPKLSSKTEDGTIISWNKTVNDYVSKGEVLYEVETEKAVHEVESLQEGILKTIYKNEGDSVSIGESIAEIETGV